MLTDREPGDPTDRATQEQSVIEQAVRPIVEAMAAQAPNGWTHAVLHGQAGRGGTSVTGGYGPGHGNAEMPNPFVELMVLAAALREAHGWDPVSLEIRCRPSGEYRFVAFQDAITWSTGTRSGFQAVLDDSCQLPQPGTYQRPGTAEPAGDPALAVARFREYLERRAAILGYPDELPPPATATALDEAERRLGRSLPADLRALYAIADGDGIGFEHRYLFQDHAWMSLEHLVAAQDEWSTGERPWFGWDLEWDAVVFDATPAHTVRRSGAHPGWLPFATRHDGNYLAADTAPARAGRVGQIIRSGRDYEDGPAYEADSVTSLLGHYLDLIDQGAYETHDDHISLGDPTRDPARDSGPHLIIGSIPDEVPPTLQAIHINDAPDLVDLAPLTAATDLRRLHLNRSTTSDLTPVRELPVESLRITLDSGDLTPLTDHPHLASLDLTTTVAGDIAPLLSVPHLCGLDLSGARVPDLSVLAGLTGLRYLCLTGRQWAALLDEGKVPPGLAAAHLADADATLDDALAWAARIGLDTGAALRLTGTVEPAGG
ncbi:SMI1/KNR4 family protein [Streptomyces sp. NPDC050433]|uniref:SMI1/KNR4 family protein n=1 Tax=unclassified Streptomyces TaxID=2593676 RepID=UPI0034490814